MVIDIIDVYGIAIFKAKRYPPIRGNPDRPMAFALSFERMQPKARKIHVARSNGMIQCRQNVPKPVDMRSGDALRRFSVVESSQRSASERPDHPENWLVACRLSSDRTSNAGNAASR